MAKSTFGSSFAQTFQQSLAAARKAEDEEKADKRFNERLAEQRAYGVMEDTKKEARALGATAEELGTYSGADNQHALELRMDELRAENKAGREASRTGKPLYAPDTETGTGEGTINPTAGFRRGFEAQQTATDEIKFNAGTQAKIAAEARAIINQERDDERLDKAIAFGASRPEVPFDFTQPIDKVEQDQAEAARMEAHNIDRMKAGLPPLPVSERLYTSGMQPEGTGTARRLMGPSIAKPTEGSFKDVFNAEQLRTLGTVRGQAGASTGGTLETKKKLSDEENISTAITRGAPEGIAAAQAQLFNDEWKRENEIKQYVLQRQIDNRIKDGERSIADAASVGYKHQTEKLFGVEIPTRESMFDFTSKYEPITYDRKQTGEDGKPIIDSSTGKEMTEKVKVFKLRQTGVLPTTPPPTGKPDGKVGRFNIWLGR